MFEVELRVISLGTTEINILHDKPFLRNIIEFHLVPYKAKVKLDSYG
jgi:hypothetical protein